MHADALGQTTSARYSKMCYSDLPYLYTGAGSPSCTGPTPDTGRPLRGDGVPRRHLLLRLGDVAWLTQLVASGPSAQVRAATPVDDLLGLPGMVTEVNTYFLVNAVLLLAVRARWRPGFLAGAHRRRPWDAIGLRALTGPAADRPGQLGHAGGGLRGRCALGLGARPAGADRRADRRSARRPSSTRCSCSAAMLVVCVRRAPGAGRSCKALAAGAAAWAGAQPAGVC